jgi:hypothetical protein
MANYARAGWSIVQLGDLGSELDHLTTNSQEGDAITSGDAILLARPAALQAKARAALYKAAGEPIAATAYAVKEGIPNVTGADHPGARAGNHIRKTVERIDIPEG